MGYHRREIPQGQFGQSSKILEEVHELLDAEEQGVTIMAMCELADLYGALRARASYYELSMDDLAKMANANERAFKDGTRKAKNDPGTSSGP